MINFSRRIDKAVRAGHIPENPDADDWKILLDAYGFEIESSNDTHGGNAVMIMARKARETKLPEEIKTAQQ